MLAALFLSACINPDFDATYSGFLFSCLAIRLLLVAMFVLLGGAGVLLGLGALGAGASGGSSH
jgi:hypothetical protein